MARVKGKWLHNSAKKRGLWESKKSLIKQETEAAEYLYEIVRKLLNKLPDTERTVMTLYYLGEMTTKEISKFLGVSVNTITSQLQRARARLQEDQERLFQEISGRLQLS